MSDSKLDGHSASSKISSAKYTMFRTSDIYFSAFLCEMEMPLEATERSGSNDRGKMIFVFRVPKNQIDRMKALYFSGSGSVKARKFVDNIRNLKQMLNV